MNMQRDFYSAFPPHDSQCKVVLFSGNSHDKDFRKNVEKELGGRKVDFLFIDGDHSESGVTADFYDYRSFVKPGGIIAFHDIVKRQLLPDNQVYHLWEKIKKEETTEEFIKDPNQYGYGIGLVRVPK